MKFELKARFTGAVLAAPDIPDDTEERHCVRAALVLAVGAKADLGGADLGGTDLLDGGQDRRGYRFVGYLYSTDHNEARVKHGLPVPETDGLRIVAGCRDFTLEEARAHWDSDSYDGGAGQGAECLARVELIATVAEARGWETKAPAEAAA